MHGFRTSAPVRTVVLQPRVTHGGSATAGTVTTADTFKLNAGSTKQALPAASPNRLQHTDASIRVRVDSADQLGTATTRATRIATSLGGYAQSVVYRTPQGGGGASYIELRIPTARVQRALAQLAGLGVLVSQQISIQDLTSKLERQSEQIAQLRRRIASLRTALQDPALPNFVTSHVDPFSGAYSITPSELLELKVRAAKRALAQRLGGRKGTVAAGETSRVSLVLTTQKHAAAAPPHRGRLGRMLHEAVGFLAIEGIVLLFALIVASPIAVALALLWFFRRRAVDRLLME